MGINSAALEESAILHTYGRFPLALAKGKGSNVWDTDGNQYLDFTSGIAVCNLGHAPDSVKTALEQQLEKLWHCSNLYHIPPQEELASLLVKNSFGDYVFFCNSGAEANEAAIKLARRYARKISGSSTAEIITFKQSFHGRTMGAMAATGQDKIHDGFHPLLEGFRYLEYNDGSALEEIAASNACAVLLELVQGEGGVVPANLEWVRKLEEICKEKGILLIIDEVQTGIGRTGTLFAYEQYGIKPDIMSLAKGLGSGFPIGAMIATREAAKGFEPGSHGSTFGGNPLASVAGLATVTTILSDNLLEDASKLSTLLDEGLAKLKEKHPSIKKVRGMGLLKGLEVNGSALDIVKAAMDEHVLLLTAGPNVVRILPPLTATSGEAASFLGALDKVLTNMYE
ncbi:acetylornithine aminotransferase [Bacillus sp. FJAT-18017]|uniref:aspartate aminotransferase family protein n=1 Tax=Bacillus sp. FJAT-18017 TaxID=1705566 RepID=UPI0006AE07D7|nr:aspartate aminotransferase family protein [Bacillus sp. FJAT-18017]ALC92139.1 acetylornithine aminotransferase [Bacillus sp. FJAT-18017]